MATFTFDTDATLLTLRTKTPAVMAGLSDLTFHNRVIFPLAKRWGVVKTKANISFSNVWDAAVSLPSIEEWSSFNPQSFTQGPVPIQFNLGDASYRGGDVYDRLEYERSQGDRNTIVDYFIKKSKDLARAQANNLNFEFFHGDGTGRRLTGLDVVLGVDLNNTVAADRIAYPSANYAGQSTVLGTHGSWPGGSTLSPPPNAALGTDYPEQTQDSEWNPLMSGYHATSPLPINSSSTSWSSGSDWATNCEEVIRYFLDTQVNLGARVADPSAPSALVMGKERFRLLKEYFSVKGRQMIPRKDGTDYGMPEHFFFEGAMLCFDFDVAPDDCYCLQPDMLTILTALPKLFVAEGPTYRMENLGWLYQTLAGPMKIQFQPKFLGRIKDYA